MQRLYIIIKRLLFFDEAYAFVFVVAVIERTIFTTFFTVIRHLKPAGTCGSFKPIKSYFDGKRIDTYARAQNPFTGNVRLSILVDICEKEEIEFPCELIIKNKKEKKETKQRQQVHIK